MIAGVPGTSPDGMSPREQLDAIQAPRQGARGAHDADLRDEQVQSAVCKPGGIQIIDWNDLKKTQREQLQEAFEERVYPVLTPLCRRPGPSVPYISDLSLNLAVVVRDPDDRHAAIRSCQGAPLLRGS